MSSHQMGRPKTFNIEWRTRAAEALPRIESARSLTDPMSHAYVEWGMAAEQLRPIITSLSMTNMQAKTRFHLAGLHALNALCLRKSG